MDAIERRIAKLERENGILKKTAIVIVVAMSAMITMGQVSPPNTVDQLRTKCLVVVDDAGRERAIPDEVKMLVWRRDQGRCVQCGVCYEECPFDAVKAG